jgi:hypothetical protein
MRNHWSHERHQAAEDDFSEWKPWLVACGIFAVGLLVGSMLT